MNVMHVWEVSYTLPRKSTIGETKMVTRYLHKSRAIRTLTGVLWYTESESIGTGIDCLGKRVSIERQMVFTDE